jgi:hypothetical protein
MTLLQWRVGAEGVNATNLCFFSPKTVDFSMARVLFMGIDKNATTESSPKLPKGFVAMISSRALLTVALPIGFGLAQIGCMALTNDDENVGAIGSVGVSTLNSSSGNGTNGASSVDVADNIERIWLAGNAPFGEENDDLIKIQIASEGPRNLLSYVVACALPVGSYTINGSTYTGKGLLNSTPSWLTTALSTQAKYDLVACIMAHVNPYDQQIDMRLTGQAVANVMAATEASAFSTPEALWVVYENAMGALVREVWPVPATAGACAYSSEDVEFRVCSSLAFQTRCGVTVKETSDFSSHCTQSVGTDNWSCDGHQAIKTWLKSEDVVALYPGCAP